MEGGEGHPQKKTKTRKKRGKGPSAHPSMAVRPPDGAWCWRVFTRRLPTFHHRVGQRVMSGCGSSQSRIEGAMLVVPFQLTCCCWPLDGGPWAAVALASEDVGRWRRRGPLSPLARGALQGFERGDEYLSAAIHKFVE